MSAAILVACLALYGVQEMMVSLVKDADVHIVQAETMVRLGAAWVPAIRVGEWWRLVTYAFVHASPMHIGGNMLGVWFLGIPIERRLGSIRFAQVSIVSCLGASALVVAIHGERALLVGVSGVIFGWAGAILPLLNREGLRSFGRWLLLNAAISLLPGVSLLGHLGGFAMGLVCGVLLRFQPQRFSMLTPVLAAIGGVVGVVAARGS